VIVSYLIIHLTLHNPDRAALVLSLAIFVFFSYGHVSNLLKDTQLFGFSFGQDRFLVPFYFGTAAMLFWRFTSKKLRPEWLTKTLNIAASILVLIPILDILFIQIKNYSIERQRGAEAIQEIGVGYEDNHAINPDIYYIVLDGYPRDDVLFNEFGYDNSEFLLNLGERGFYVARCSQANYSYTQPSLASTLNMTYLGDQGYQNTIAYDEAHLIGMIENSTVQSTVEKLGYTTITFDTGYKWLTWSDPDMVFSPFSNRDKRYKYTNLNEFEVLLLGTTAASILLDRIDLDDWITIGPRQIQQNRILYDFEKLAEIPQLVPETKFVYAHITSPHPPFIFGPNGALLTNDPESELEGYVDQIAYINTLVLGTIDVILSESFISPVIIVQSDHGASIDYESQNIDPAMKLGILNAYHIPGINPDLLYPSISPVNTFRLIFNTYLDGNFELLEDLSIFGNSSPFQQLECDPNGFR